MLIAGKADPVLIRKERVLLCELPESKQPYHAAEKMMPGEAQQFIAQCRLAATELACKFLMRFAEEAAFRNLSLRGVGLAASLSRPLPSLPEILRSHALIHAAEGVFYRETTNEAAHKLNLEVRLTSPRSATALLETNAPLKSALAMMGKTSGPPWTMDEKLATIAALSVVPSLARNYGLHGEEDFSASRQ